MKGHDLYPGLFLTTLGVGGCILASRLGLGTMGSPGAGLIPFAIAAVLALMAAGMVAGKIHMPSLPNLWHSQLLYAAAPRRERRAVHIAPIPAQALLHCPAMDREIPAESKLTRGQS